MVVGGQCDFSVSPFGLDFGTLDFGLRLDKNHIDITLHVSLQLSDSSSDPFTFDDETEVYLLFYRARSCHILN